METKYINVHDNQKGMINTHSGMLVDLLNPTSKMICAEDIAHALSHICRFGGHTRGFYSVAEHSILVAALAPDDLKLEALLHDATEAYIGDIIKPLKNLIGDWYGLIELSFSEAISEKFGLDANKLLQVKRFDRQALELEHEAYIKGCDNTYATIENIMVSEIGDTYYPGQIPSIFLNLLKEYGHETV